MNITELNFEVVKQCIPGTDGKEFCVDIFNENKCIAGVYVEEHANLLAAAPDMLKALKAALVRLTWADKYLDCTDDIKIIKQAIEKAEK